METGYNWNLETFIIFLKAYMKSDSNENNLNILFGESTNGC